jgi:CAAX prenyl protease-like protein
MQPRQKNMAAITRYRIQSLVKRPWVPYVFPFIGFMVLTEAARYFPAEAHFLYIIKTFMVGALLWFWRHAYAPDLALKLTPSGYLAAVAVGLMVLAAWILPEKILPQLGIDAAFNPNFFNWPPIAVWALMAVRLAGATIVVPVMEELFWRSFLLRYVINPDFSKIALGTFSWLSFAVVVVLFGIEHHRLIQGMIAGAFYTALVIRQKSLRGCILAHGVTNLGLGVYVIATQQWIFW